MSSGKIKWYDEKKGYGFIEVEDGEDLFFHKSAIESQGYFGVRKFDSVTFEVRTTARGPQAVKVRILPA